MKRSMMRLMGATARAVIEPELDRATLELCRTGDSAALRAFVVRYERLVFALLSRMLGRVPEVEDLAQETFVRALRALARFDLDGPARPSTWLLTIATRLALDRLKRPSRRLEPHVYRDVEADLGVELASPERQTSLGELRHAIHAAVDALPSDQRAAFVLAEFHDFSLAEIAATLSVPANTVKTRLFRAREKLARALAEFGGIE